jgi:hypothetical protein
MGILGTFLGENTPTVSPSSFTATPISAKTASRCNRIISVRFNLSSHVSFNSATQFNGKLIQFSMGTMYMSSIEIRGFRLHRQSISHFPEAGPLRLPLEMELTPVADVVVLRLRQSVQQLPARHFPLDSLERRRKTRKNEVDPKWLLSTIIIPQDKT